MKIKTSELTGAALDWAVAKCEEPIDHKLTVIRREDYIGQPIHRETEHGSYVYEWWAPSRNWSQGGPIIERERICVEDLPSGINPAMHPTFKSGDLWEAKHFPNGADEVTACGPTYLIAAMRCYVSAHLGDLVEVPDELA